MFRNRKTKTDELQAAQAQLEAASDSQARADQALIETQGQWPTIQSVVTVIQRRKKRNHFGDEFEITFTPRERRAT